jgi:hypothetical protein
MLPGQALDLDHRYDGGGWLGFAHAACNRRAGGRLGAARRRERTRRMRAMPSVALGVEIAAGPVDGSDMILVDLVAYLDGTDVAGAILELREVREVVAVAIDPHSPAATLL